MLPTATSVLFGEPTEGEEKTALLSKLPPSTRALFEEPTEREMKFERFESGVDFLKGLLKLEKTVLESGEGRELHRYVPCWLGVKALRTYIYLIPAATKDDYLCLRCELLRHCSRLTEKELQRETCRFEKLYRETVLNSVAATALQAAAPSVQEVAATLHCVAATGEDAAVAKMTVVHERTEMAVATEACAETLVGAETSAVIEVGAGALEARVMTVVVLETRSMPLMLALVLWHRVTLSDRLSFDVKKHRAAARLRLPAVT